VRLGSGESTGDGLHSIGHLNDDETEDDQDVVFPEAHPLLDEPLEVKIALSDHHYYIRQGYIL